MERAVNGPGRGWVLLLATFILGASIVLGTLIVARTIWQVKTFNTSLLTVTGSTARAITSDEVKWTASFSREAPADALKTGYSEMSHDLGLVQTFLQQHGISSSAITVSPVTLNPIYNNCGPLFKQPTVTASAGCVNEIVRYRLVQTIEVDSGAVQPVTALAQNHTLDDEGVLFSTGRLSYYYTKLAGLRQQLLAAATRDAQVRAQRIAASTGIQLGHLVSVDTGVIQITPPNSTEIANVGSYDTRTIPKVVTAVVRASFTVNP